ncbi:MAG: phosphodiester glycosidase family protein [Deltaproteobacteria bacterium]|nr:phosphodiester glycosidase family protein [Deltaproteobacteria bacterium]
MGLSLFLSLVGVGPPAEATDYWSSTHRGIRHLRRTVPGAEVHAVLVDLQDPELAVVATRPQDQFITTRQFASRYDARVALNANFFARGSCGLAVGGGEVFPRAYEDGCGASLGFGRANEAGAFDSLGVPRGPVPLPWMTEVLTGKPWLLRGGRPTWNWTRPQHIYRPNPRSALGVTADRRTLVLVAADGRRYGVPGMTGFQLVSVLQEFGVSDAINLDGGGSTTLVMDGRIANRVSDRQERTVLSHVGVRVLPGAVWYAAEVLSQRGQRVGQRGEVLELQVEARTTGRRPWRPADQGGGSPRLELSDGAVGYTASVEAPTEPGQVGRFILRWQARAPGQRTLRARLLAPDGAPLSDRPLDFAVAVREAPKARPATERPEVMAASMGCEAGRRSPSRGAWAVLVGFLIALSRVRPRPGETVR